jgi:hypothetical protein
MIINAKRKIYPDNDYNDRQIENIANKIIRKHEEPFISLNTNRGR